MTAIVIDTLRLSPVASSEATYLSCMVWRSRSRCQVVCVRASTAWSGRVRCQGPVGRTSGLVAVDATRLVTDDVARLQLDDALAHLVDDAGVVRRHHDGGAGAVDPVEQLHDADGGGRVQVSG